MSLESAFKKQIASLFFFSRYFCFFFKQDVVNQSGTSFVVFYSILFIPAPFDRKRPKYTGIVNSDVCPWTTVAISLVQTCIAIMRPILKQWRLLHSTLLRITAGFFYHENPCILSNVYSNLMLVFLYSRFRHSVINSWNNTECEFFRLNTRYSNQKH